MYRLAHVVNSLLDKGKESNVAITPLKLQKLLYFFYRDYLIATGKPLFAYRFEPWEYGPVIAEVYYVFKHFGATPITEFMKDEEGKKISFDTNGRNQYSDTFNLMWLNFGTLSGRSLVMITHQEGSAWYKAYQGDYPFLEDCDIAADFTKL